MAYTSKNCRHFFTKDYRRFFNTTSIQTRLQQPILVNVYDRYIHTRDRERERSFPRKELAITRRYDHFERNWIPYKGGELYREKRNGLTHIQGILLEEDNLRNSLSPLNRAMIRIVFSCTSSGNDTPLKEIIFWRFEGKSSGLVDLIIIFHSSL